jgi:hypothetical protein
MKRVQDWLVVVAIELGLAYGLAVTLVVRLFLSREQQLRWLARQVAKHRERYGDTSSILEALERCRKKD